MLKNILIKNHQFDENGGITQFYRMMRPYLDRNIHYRFYKIYTVPIVRIIAHLFNLCDFFIRMIFGSYEGVVINLPLYRNAVLRDSVYAFVAKKIFSKKLYVFWHGWSDDYADCHLKNQPRNWFLRNLFRADKMFVLAEKFKEKIEQTGYSGNKIVILSTVVEPSVFEIEHCYSDRRPIRLLFLSRVLVSKGIFILIDAFHLLQRKYPGKYELIIAGDGNDYSRAADYVNQQEIRDVVFLGYVKGKDKEDVLKNADIWILPSFSEGLPCALLEAMAAGLPVIVSRVGGIPDFFENDKMGYMTDSKDPKEYADLIEIVSASFSKMELLGSYNRRFANEHFRPENAADCFQTAISH